MQLQPGRVEQMITDADDDNTAIICHSTLPTSFNAVCHGYFERRSSATLRLAELLDMIEFDEPVSVDQRSNTATTGRSA